uniref:FAD-binding domain-containing protein n=1 Tax=Guillardia theta TaxID=55529 RepID=A0A7S4PEB2_GUITH
MALAAALVRKGIDVSVYERDAAMESRSQGYGLTMQQGGKALKELGITMKGISSICHYSLLPDGEVIGWYGRQWRSAEGSRKEELCWKCKGTTWKPQKNKDAKAGKPKTTCTVCAGTGRMNAETIYNVHIPRQQLRAELFAQLPAGVVKWGHQFVRFEEDSTQGDVIIHFGNDVPSDRVSILVAADGIYSGVKMQILQEFLDKSNNDNTRIDELADILSSHPRDDLISTPPARCISVRDFEDKASQHYLMPLKVIVILGITNVHHPLLKQRVFQTLNGETRIYVMPFCEGNPYETMWQLSFPYPQSSDGSEPTDLSPSSLKRMALERCKDWHRPIPELIESTKLEGLTGYPAFDADLRLLQHTLRQLRDRRSRVTLLGDAAHPMSPFKGQGANQALLDAVSLARFLSLSDWAGKREGDGNGEGCGKRDLHDYLKGCGRASMCLSDALGSYEEEMMQRSRKKVVASRDAARVLHSPAACAKTNCVRASAALAAEGFENDPEGLAKRTAITEEELLLARDEIRRLISQ